MAKKKIKQINKQKCSNAFIVWICVHFRFFCIALHTNWLEFVVHKSMKLIGFVGCNCFFFIAPLRHGLPSVMRRSHAENSFSARIHKHTTCSRRRRRRTLNNTIHSCLLVLLLYAVHDMYRAAAWYEICRTTFHTQVNINNQQVNSSMVAEHWINEIFPRGTSEMDHRATSNEYRDYYKNADRAS